jgi:hypothetical protein
MFPCSQQKYAELVMDAVSPEYIFRKKACAWFRREYNRRNRIIGDCFITFRPVPYPPLPTA